MGKSKKNRPGFGGGVSRTAACRRKDNRTPGRKVAPPPAEGSGSAFDQVAPLAKGIKGATCCPVAIFSNQSSSIMPFAYFSSSLIPGM